MSTKRIELLEDEENCYWIREGDRVAFYGGHYVGAVLWLHKFKSGRWGCSDWPDYFVEDFHDWTARQSSVPKTVAVTDPTVKCPLRQQLFDCTVGLQAYDLPPVDLERRAARQAGVSFKWLRDRLEGKVEMSYLELLYIET